MRYADAFWGASARMAGRRKTTTKQIIDRDYPYQVELKLPWGGFRALDGMYAFCRGSKFTAHPTRRGLECFTRWCFQERTLADNFRAEFGGRRIDAITS